MNERDIMELIGRLLDKFRAVMTPADRDSFVSVATRARMIAETILRSDSEARADVEALRRILAGAAKELPLTAQPFFTSFLSLAKIWLLSLEG